MQNRFVGDIGDFGKYGLLRNITKSGLIIGVNWYFTKDGSDSAGGRIEYLLDNYEGYVLCDRELYQELHKLVHIENNRNIQRIEKSGLLPSNTEFFSQILKSGQIYRENWYKESLRQLANSEIIFLDPDNNIVISKDEIDYTSKDTMYVIPHEIEEYYKHGKSLVIYNHIDRSTEEDYLKRFDSIISKPIFSDARILVMKYSRYSLRYYLVILKPNHSNLVEGCIDDMIAGPWGSVWKRWRNKPHFTKIEIGKKYVGLR